MAWRTPLVEGDTLHEPAGSISLALGSAEWFVWLADEQHCSFHFRHPAGEFTARKERRQRGQSYWIAYRQVHNRLYKHYLGKAETLTAGHLAAAAAALTRASTVD